MQVSGALLLRCALLAVAAVAAEEALRVGSSVNAMANFGVQYNFTRALPVYDGGLWWFREPFVSHLKGVVTEPYDPLGAGVAPEHGSKPFRGQFQVFLCDDEDGLQRAVLSGVRVEMLQRPWRAFVGVMEKGMTEQFLGLPADYAGWPYSFILVRLARYYDAVRMAWGVHLRLPDYVLEDLDTRDQESAATFMKEYGTHYVAAYAKGDALFQVLVYKRWDYASIKERLRPVGNARRLSDRELQLLSRNAVRVGHVKAVSGNRALEWWAEYQLATMKVLRAYNCSLLALRGDARRLRELYDQLGNHAVLQLDLRSQGAVLPDAAQRFSFAETLSNRLALWDAYRRSSTARTAVGSP